MLNIDNNGIVSLSRGDSFAAILFINQAEKWEDPIRYDLRNYPGSAVYMGIMAPNQSFECAMIKKKFGEDSVNEEGDVELSVGSDETECMCPGKYYYEVKVRVTDTVGNQTGISTVIPRTEFFIMG